MVTGGMASLPGASAPARQPLSFRLMATYRVMSWQNIPAQIKATDDLRKAVSRPLPSFFQQEIDRVAMQEGLMDTDDYLEGWSWSEPAEREGSVEDVAEAVAAEVAEEWRRAHT